MSQRLLKMTVNLCRIIVALTFIFSGFVKAIDPIGLQYKLQDYLGAIGIPGFLPDWMLLIMAVLLAAVEFCMGIFLLFAIQRRLISKLIVVFMSIMTLITVWLVVANPVKDCGCFGDALHLTNTETLVKNIILLGCSIVIMQRPLAMFRFISESNQWIVINYTIVFIFVSSGLSLYYLPLFDFRPYRIGTNIPRGMEIPKDAEQPLFETTFIMEKGGQRKEFTLNDYPDSTWKFIDSKTVQVKEGYIPPIHDFSIADRKTGKDLTDSVLRHKGYTFLLIAPYLERADDSNFGDIDQLYEYAQTYNIPFYCLTASTAKAIQRWRDITGAEYPFCITDETTLKTIVRSNPGLLLLKDGTIINKWSHNQLPNGAKLSLPITQSALGKMPQDSVPGKILEIILWFILPLTLLTLADRLWAWSKWVRLKEKKDKQRLYQLFNKKKSKMRKKIVAGNWKMNLNLQEGIALAKEINEAMTAEKPNCDVVICTPFIHLASVAQVLNADLVGLGAENCADKEKGAFTGEVSAEMVKAPVHST